ncbi:hypothetical protein ACJIZ3_025355 [Penstemon smallii]|uniref:Uncharacterized protein n=1 Tax=Penstemon smallii TaxID=265156 RepID=A0ABD3TUD1_9LAMI
MKQLFNWMQSKFNGEQENKKQKSIPPPTKHIKKEEFSDWPNGILLAIGTLGDPDLRDDKQVEEQNKNDNENPQECSELGKLQKELTKLLSRKPASKVSEEEHNANGDHLPLDRFLNCPSSLEVDRTISNRFSSTNSDYDTDDQDEIDRTIRIILGRCKDIVCEKKKKNGIGKNSLSFLFKKMFLCSSGFAPTPSLRDTFQESRMEKLLRTMLHKTMNSQNSSKESSTMKYLEDNRLRSKVEKENELHDESRVVSKWVKTDSESHVMKSDQGIIFTGYL